MPIDNVDDELSSEDEGAALILITSPMSRNPVQPMRNAVGSVFASCVASCPTRNQRVHNTVTLETYFEVVKFIDMKRVGQLPSLFQSK